jgi:hypothetical protein
MANTSWQWKTVTADGTWQGQMANGSWKWKTIVANGKWRQRIANGQPQWHTENGMTNGDGTWRLANSNGKQPKEKQQKLFGLDYWLPIAYIHTVVVANIEWQGAMKRYLVTSKW